MSRHWKRRKVAADAAYRYQCAFHPQDCGRYPGEPDWDAMTRREIEATLEALGL